MIGKAFTERCNGVVDIRRTLTARELEIGDRKRSAPAGG